MKKILLTLLSSVAIFGCSSDDDTSSSSPSINGKWKHVKSYIIFNNEILADQTDIYNHNCTTTNDYLEFNTNNSGIEREYYESCNYIDDAFTYSKTGEFVTMNFEDYVWEAKVYEVTDNVLKLQDITPNGRIYEYRK